MSAATVRQVQTDILILGSGVGAVADSYGVLAAQWIFVAIGLFIFVVVGLSSISEGRRFKEAEETA